MAMKTRSLGIAFAALLALAPARSSAQDTASPAAPSTSSPAANPADPPASVPRPSILPKHAEDAAPVATDAKPRKARRYARKHYRHHAYWEPFPIFLPRIHRHHVSWRRLAWFRWF
jgi:hypothetical protein